jgi:branched-chain amino acid transport system ATP-binding protein
MSQILELVDIHTYYGESHVIQGVSLEIEEGSIVGLLGRNGMGKTTLVHSIIGFTPPRHGRVVFRGKELTSLKDYQIPRMGVALVPQGRRIFPSLSVKENITMAARCGEKSNTWTLDRVYSLFPILKQRASYKGNLISGGEQQMLCIGRALTTNPDLLLMDEPSEGLAPLVVQELIRVIGQVNRSGISILLVEQNLNMALALADYLYILSKGKIVYKSTPTDLRKNKEAQTNYLGISISKL